MEFDFDTLPDRNGTHSVKYDDRLGKFGRADVRPLWVADMDFATAPCVREALAERAAHPLYGYTVVPQALYTAVIDWQRERHGWSIERDWILFCPGTLPAISAVIQACTGAHDGVLIQPPVYGPFDALPRGAGRTLVHNFLLENDGHYGMDHADLERKAASTRLMLLCNPHNPVGRNWSRDDLQALLALSRKHDFTVFSDDIHGDIDFDGQFLPLGRLAGPGDRVISAVSPCKTFNLQGLALTALVIPDTGLRHRVAAELQQRHLTNFNPFSLVAATAAWQRGGPWCDALVAYLRKTRDAMLGFVARELAPVRLHAPQAGYLAWLDARGLGLDDAGLRDFFIRECALGLSPGTDFGTPGSGFMRFNFAAPRTGIMQALQTIRQAMHHRQAGSSTR